MKSAHNNRINFSYIGTNARGDAALSNGESGVFLGAGTSGTKIGSRDPNLFTLISGNTGHGIEMEGTTGNVVVATTIGLRADGILPLPNLGSGVFLFRELGQPRWRHRTGCREHHRI